MAGIADFSALEPVLEAYTGQAGSLITILQKAQDIYGYLPPELLRHVAKRTGKKPAHVFGVATFYAQFRDKPAGKHVVLFCQGTACHVNGSAEILESVCEFLGVGEGGTTEDGLFTVESVACLGCCSLSPVMMIGGEAYGGLTTEKARKILTELRTQSLELSKASSRG